MLGRPINGMIICGKWFLSMFETKIGSRKLTEFDEMHESCHSLPPKTASHTGSALECKHCGRESTVCVGGKEPSLERAPQYIADG